MANDVYLQTHDGLTAIVSARVATRVLGNALRVRGLKAEAVRGDQMSELLLGVVFRELEHTLPREGLKRNLETLAAKIDSESEKRPPAPEGPAPTTLAREPGAPRSLSAFKAQLASALILEKEPALAESGSSDSDGMTQDGRVGARAEAPITPLLRKIEAELEAAKGPPRSGVSAQGARRATAVAPKPASKSALATAGLPFSDEALEQAVLRFAQIDHITLVAALHKDGSIAASRGSGMDLQALARYGLMGLKLLRRGGPLRSYYLAHTHGQLFLLPIGTDVIIVVGTPDLNIGAVFTALSTLKEEV